ncbi:hypothetical protein [Duganella sp. FT27W]|uniref:hypothetical protein n=1 Tax=Duganella sp. FT27W TaxID=2654636 RepID=UPI00128D2D93|nr:hypothetical protein [Duganella sp. FT27W]MPQ55118.1 hypothetical protein [Duganella sp. FT27W]
MPDICILCKKPASTGEHLFPAAMGGRRENQGIYCAEHNRGFSGLVNFLVKQVAALNARLGVLHDRGHKPQKYSFTDTGTGREYTIFGNHIEPNMPGSATTKNDGEDSPTYHFAGDSQFQQWLKRERKKPGKIVFKKIDKIKSFYLTERPTLSTEFGGTEGMRTIAYIALTHFAHYFPDESRQPGMNAFKAYVLGGENIRFAWWDILPETIKQAAQFEFSHWIIIGVSASTQRAYARMSLFGLADFSVNFGAINVSADKEVAVEINPTALHYPQHVNEQVYNIVKTFPIYPTEPEETYRPRVLQTCVKALSKLLEKLERKELEQLLDEIFPVLAESAAMARPDRVECVHSIVGIQSQRVLMLLKTAVSGLAKQFQESYLADVVRDEIDSFIQPDASSQSGLSEKTEHLLGLALARFEAELLHQIETGRLDRASLASLLDGGPGAAVVGPVVMPFLKEAVVRYMAGRDALRQT